MTERGTMEVGKRYEIQWEARDIGYGIEYGGGLYAFLGREDWPFKLIFREVGGDLIYLFDDELIEVDAAPFTTLDLMDAGLGL